METSRPEERNRERLAGLHACERLAPHEIGAAGHRASRPLRRENRWLLPGLAVDPGTRSVLLDRLDPCQRGRLALVHFTARDDLTVGGYQVEVVLAVRRLLEHELARHIAS